MTGDDLTPSDIAAACWFAEMEARPSLAVLDYAANLTAGEIGLLGTYGSTW